MFQEYGELKVKVHTASQCHCLGHLDVGGCPLPLVLTFSMNTLSQNMSSTTRDSITEVTAPSMCKTAVEKDYAFLFFFFFFTRVSP